MAKKRTYRVLFFNRGTVYELYVRDVHPSSVYGFVKVEGFMFGEKSSMVIDPSEERLSPALTVCSELTEPCMPS